ncbi:MAG: hypothetical protein M3164_04390 [Actinomycetota bacterium]|nr:hypothetical protein [Actinomycetota bacterium]
MAAVRTQAIFDAPQGRPIYGLIALGVLLGIPIGLGLVPVNMLALLGALIASMLGRGLLTRTTLRRLTGVESNWDDASGWFVVLSWCILALPLHVNSFDVERVLAVQAVLGPAPLVLGPAASSAIWAAFFLGLVAASAWSGVLPSLARPDYRANEALDVVTRWGESALAGTAVAATLWGPSVGAIARGPFNSRALLTVTLSFAITCLAVAGVSFGRRFVTRIPQAPAAMGVGGLAISAMLVAAFVR